MAADPVVILSAARTPLGRFMGDLSPFAAHKLGSHVIGAALERAKLAPERIDGGIPEHFARDHDRPNAVPRQ